MRLICASGTSAVIPSHLLSDQGIRASEFTLLKRAQPEACSPQLSYRALTIAKRALSSWL
jgi:hypothetical protein